MIAHNLSLFPEEPHTFKAFVPRYYQDAAVQASQMADITGAKRHIIEIPTGGGKTLMAGEQIRQYRAVDRDFTALFLTPRKDLVWQTYSAFTQHFFRPEQVGRVQSTYNEVGRSIIVSTPQTLMVPGRLDALLKAQGRPFDMIIPDECHIFGASWLQMIQPLLRDQTLLVGLSATPYRADGIMLDYLFPDDIVYSVDFWELIASGHLVDVHSIDIPLADLDLSGVDDDELNSTGESDTVPSKELDKRLEASASRLRTAYEAFMQIAQQKRTVLFAQNLPDARAFEKYFTAHGVECKVITGKTPDDERKREYASADSRFRKGELKLLIGFNVLTTGLDIPEIECIIMARAIKNNRGLYTQAVGRGMRTAPGKTELLLIHLTDKKYTLMTMGKLIGVHGELPSARAYMHKKLSEEQRLLEQERKEQLQQYYESRVYCPPQTKRLHEIHAYASDVFTGGGWTRLGSGDYSKDYGQEGVIRAEKTGVGYNVVAYQKKRSLLWKPQVLTTAPLDARAAMVLGHQHMERARIVVSERTARRDAHRSLLDGTSADMHTPATSEQIAYLQQRRVVIRGSGELLTQGRYAEAEKFLSKYGTNYKVDAEGVKHCIMVSHGRVHEWEEQVQPKVKKERKKTA